MMGVQDPEQDKLFYSQFSLEKRVRQNHPLRKVDLMIDFDFVYAEVKHLYGLNGNVSVPPPIILKLMFLLIVYNVSSERELMATLPERLDWLWFLGFDLDSEIPNHSVLSKARKRWGMDVFSSFFERIVWQCVEAGLVDGSKIFVDSSLVEADASLDSTIDLHSLKGRLKADYLKLEERLTEVKAPRGVRARGRKLNNRLMSTTDPDASIVRHGGQKLAYAVHRSVDESHEVITSTRTSAGDVNEAHLLGDLLDDHHKNTGRETEVVVADKKYGTIENFMICHDRGVEAHMKSMTSTTEAHRTAGGRFGPNDFTYDADNDEYICPAGNRLTHDGLNHKWQTHRYRAKGSVCLDCTMRQQCTNSRGGRMLNRYVRQRELDCQLEISRSRVSRKNIAKRQHLMERSFAHGKRYGYKRARWRGLWRVRIQQLMISAVQNIQILLKKGHFPSGIPAAAAVSEPDQRIKTVILGVLRKFLRGLTTNHISSSWNLECIA
jgi:transposase